MQPFAQRWTFRDCSRLHGDPVARFFIGFVSLAFAALVRAQPPQADGPPPLYSFGLAYDDARQRLVLFGGYYDGAYSGDTWEWDGVRWQRVSQIGPPARNSPKMVFDAARGKVVMFGGDTRTAGAFGDSWEWDGRTWTQIPGAGPTARSLHGMVYDSHRQRTILFGGRAGPDFRTDTWELGHDGWRKVADSGPPPRMLHAMAYDPKQRKTLVMGGNRALAAPVEGDVYGDVWTWDGARWEQNRSGPGARDHTAAAYDPAHEVTIVVSGTSVPAGLIADAWSWNGGSQWAQVPMGALGARAGHAMATDSRNRRVLLYGGFSASAPARELWEYSVNGWRRLW